MRTTCSVLALALAGCGAAGPERLPVYPVRGSVFAADGKPAVGANVVFRPTDGRELTPPPFGTVGADGGFALTSYAGGDGAPEGAYAVTVVWRTASPDGEASGPDRLKGKYADAKSPAATANVKPGDNALEPIRLK